MKCPRGCADATRAHAGSVKAASLTSAPATSGPRAPPRRSSITAHGRARPPVRAGAAAASAIRRKEGAIGGIRARVVQRPQALGADLVLATRTTPDFSARRCAIRRRPRGTQYQECDRIWPRSSLSPQPRGQPSAGADDEESFARERELLVIHKPDRAREEVARAETQVARNHSRLSRGPASARRRAERRAKGVARANRAPRARQIKESASRASGPRRRATGGAPKARKRSYTPRCERVDSHPPCATRRQVPHGAAPSRRARQMERPPFGVCTPEECGHRITAAVGADSPSGRLTARCCSRAWSRAAPEAMIAIGSASKFGAREIPDEIVGETIAVRESPRRWIVVGVV